MTDDARAIAEQAQWLRMNVENHVAALSAAPSVGKWHVLRAELICDAALAFIAASDAALSAAREAGRQQGLEDAAGLRKALTAIKAGLAADNKESGDYWAARELLSKLGVYHGNLSGTRLLLELAVVSLRAAAPRPQEKS
jgi:hypothetical protein